MPLEQTDVYPLLSLGNGTGEQFMDTVALALFMDTVAIDSGRSFRIECLRSVEYHGTVHM